MLKLQKVELLGFKSFADRTEIAFHGNGVAAVVGPNGCGKSNISDAIHWVLGEQSAKTLRSGRMQDVLFNGTPSRKATGLAEVKLTLLDPEAIDSPTASANGRAAEANRNGDGGVITVARRLFASGESEYLLNDRACRLRDIQELFLGTGLGPDSYAIIEQGRIGQILSAKPYERRALIEEAAGITRFKAKRKLAWAKLESSKQNLARVSDILEEVTKQVHSLQRQAARARRYKELREQVQAQLKRVLGSRSRQTEEQAAQTALELSLLRGVLEEQRVRAEQHEGALRDLHQQLEQLELELRRAAEERTTLRVEAERARGQVTTHAQQIAYAVRRVEEAQAEQAQIQARQEAQRPEREQCALVTAQLQQEREALEKELRGWEASGRLCQQDLEEKEQRREQLSREILEAVGQAAALRNQLSQQEQYLGWTTKQMGQLDSQDSEMEAAQEAAVLRCRQSEELLRGEGAEREQVSTQRAALEESLRAAREKETRCRGKLGDLRTELAAQRERLRSLEEILARHTYSTETVQRLLEAQASQRVGEGSAAGAHAGLRFEAAGLLADFLEVEPASERVVEEFLREELEYVVVKDWDSAEKAVHLLRTELPGRATFLLETAARTTQQNGSGSGRGERNVPAGVRPLASCVRFTNGFAGTAGSLLPKLDRCYLVEDAGQGRTLAAEHPELYFLTPEGIWFQGALVSAGKADAQGPLALKRELRTLGATLHENESAAETKEAELNRTVQQIAEQQAELQRLVQQEQDCEKRLMLAERDQQEAAADARRFAERLALLALERERLEREAERTRGQWSQNNYEMAQCEQRRAELESEVQTIQTAASERKVQREAAQVCETELRSRLAGLEERQRTTAESLARLEQIAEQLTARRAELAAQCAQWADQRTQWEQECRSLEEQSVAADRRAEELTACMAEMESRATGHRRSVQEREQEAPRLRQELEQTREKRSATEVQLARLQSELDHLRETCRNELGVELETLADVGVAPPEGAPVFGTALERALQKDTPLEPEALAEAEEQYRQLRTKLENLGPINMMALEEFEECRTRHEFLERQRQDLQDSIRDTTQAIGEIDAICNRQFTEAFAQISAHFQRTFTQLFGGGQGMLRLMEVEEPADAPAKVFAARQEEAGIEIIAQPPGKRLQNVLLLSGGEKALAALALLVAIFRYKPSPFCILDEVDAPLDDANIGRFTELVQEMSRDTQFILITHSKRTMSIAPVMYGVTMQEPGVSKIVSVRFHGATPTASDAAASREAASTEAHALVEAVA